MSGWDEGNQRMEGMPIRAQEPGNADAEVLSARFANFLKNFTENAQNFFLYREQLVSQNEVQLEGTAFIRVLLDHLIMFDRDLSERLIATPAKTIHAFESAASDVYYELTQNRRAEGDNYKFQVQFYSKAGSDGVRNNLRTLGSADVTKLVVLDGIIIRAAPPRAKASSIIVRCRKCQQQLTRITVRPGVAGFAYPRYCRNEACDKPQDSLYIVPELSEFAAPPFSRAIFPRNFLRQVRRPAAAEAAGAARERSSIRNAAPRVHDGRPRAGELHRRWHARAHRWHILHFHAAIAGVKRQARKRRHCRQADIHPSHRLASAPQPRVRPDYLLRVHPGRGGAVSRVVHGPGYLRTHFPLHCSEHLWPGGPEKSRRMPAVWRRAKKAA
jgi:predicted nucleotidyltransferase